MNKSFTLAALGPIAMLMPFLTAACSGGGGASISAAQPAVTPVVLPAPNVDSATLGANSPVLAASSMTLATMQVGTVLPLRQSVGTNQINSISPASGLEALGATLTYKGTQTVNGVSVPTFDLNVPGQTSKAGTTYNAISVSLNGKGGSNDSYSLINGAVFDVLNYTLTANWSEIGSDTFGSVYAMGVTGFQTPSSGVPTSGQATYLGNGTNSATGSVQGLIFTDIYGGYHPPATVSGSASSFSVDFASGQITGTLSGLKAVPVFNDGAVGAPQDWNQISIAGTLSGAILSGTTSTPAQPSGGLGFGAASTGKIDGALYGPRGEELGAVWSLQDSKTFSTAFGVVSATKQ